MPDQPEMGVLTVSEAAEILRIGRRQAYEAVHRGEIPSFRIGKSIRIPTKSLQRKLLGSQVSSLLGVNGPPPMHGHVTESTLETKS